MILTVGQITESLERLAGDSEPDVEITFDKSEKGTFAWLTDYPDEGSIALDGRAEQTQKIYVDGNKKSVREVFAERGLEPPTVSDGDLDGIIGRGYEGVDEQTDRNPENG